VPMVRGRPPTTGNGVRLLAGCCTTGLRPSRPTGGAGRSAGPALDGSSREARRRSAV